MKIRVIGSGSMWTNYNSASYMIDDDILVDMPNGMCKYLFKLGINPQMVKYVLITHLHGDHYFDMPFYFLLKSRADDKKIKIYCSKDGKRKINKLLNLSFADSARDIKKKIFLKYEFKSNFKVGNYNVKKYLVDHGKMKPAYGYIFEYKKKKIGFTGDTSLCENIEYLASVCEYLFCDCMFILGTNKHMGINNIKYLCQKYPKCKFVVSHLNNETRNMLLESKLNNIIIPNDGDFFNIN